MTVLKGLSYNFRGLAFSLRTPSLLILGIARLLIILVLSLIAIGLVLSKYREITNLIWLQPENPSGPGLWQLVGSWLLWLLWHLASWLLVLLLAALSTLFAFLISQILFSIVIMDYMSRITERKSTGKEATPPRMPWFSYFIYLFKQEIPRAVIPIMISMGLMILGWLTPLSPVLTLLSPIVAATFLAWDNTDLLPARRLEPFRNRFRFLRQHLQFHVGFGLGFLIPVLNILLLSFAPVGATLFHVDQEKFVKSGH